MDVKELDHRFQEGIQCVRVVIGSKQRTWVSISEIAIFVKEGDKNLKVTGGAVNIVGGGSSAKAAISFGPGDGPAAGTSGLHHNRTSVETNVFSKENSTTGTSLTAGTRQNTTIVNADAKVSEGKHNSFSVEKRDSGNRISATEPRKNGEGGSPKDKITVSGSSDEARKETGGDTDKIVIEMSDGNGTVSVVSAYYATRPRAEMLSLFDAEKNGSVVRVNEVQDVFAHDVELAPSSDGRKQEDMLEIPSHLVSKTLSKISSPQQEQVSQLIFSNSVSETQMPNTKVVRKHNFSRVNNHQNDPRFLKGRL